MISLQVNALLCTLQHIVIHAMQLSGVNSGELTPLSCIFCTQPENYAHVGLRDGGPVFLAPPCIFVRQLAVIKTIQRCLVRAFYLAIPYFKIIIIIMFLKSQACFLFLDPQNEVGPSISSSVVLCSFVLLVYIVRLVLVLYFFPSSVRVVATFSGIVLFPSLCSVLLFFP